MDAKHLSRGLKNEVFAIEYLALFSGYRAHADIFDQAPKNVKLLIFESVHWLESGLESPACEEYAHGRCHFAKFIAADLSFI